MFTDILQYYRFTSDTNRRSEHSRRSNEVPVQQTDSLSILQSFRQNFSQSTLQRITGVVQRIHELPGNESTSTNNASLQHSVSSISVLLTPHSAFNSYGTQWTAYDNNTPPASAFDHYDSQPVTNSSDPIIDTMSSSNGLVFGFL